MSQDNSTHPESNLQSAAPQKNMLARLPLYYAYIAEKQRQGICYVSSTEIARALKLNSILVRKDLAFVARQAGKPRMGFEIAPLMNDLTTILGYDNTTDALLVGVGRLGRTLLSYKGFERCGLNIVAGFDANDDFVDLDINGKPVFHVSQLPLLAERLRILIGIITVPAENAQEVADLMVRSGIKAIWNFAPTHIKTPDDVLVRYENLAASLAALSQQLQLHLIEEESTLSE